MMARESLTSMLYRLARLSADGRAIRQGPTAMAKRYVRKQVYKKTNTTLAAILRQLLK